MAERARSLGWSSWPLPIVFIALAVCIHNESFWTDEITSAWLCAQSSWRDLGHAIRATGSEAQMPLFILYLWSWARLFGTSEWALRAANLPWALLALLSLRPLLRRHASRPSAALLLALPLVCYQMNEARPYMMGLALAALALNSLDAWLAAAREMRAPARRDLALLLTGWLLCLGTSMLNLFLLPALGVYALVCCADTAGPHASFVRRGVSGLRDLARTHGRLLGLAAIGTAMLGSYYLGTLALGHGGRRLAFTAANLSFAAYEWLGFGGLGAPRLLLRESGAWTTLRPFLPSLLAGAAAWALVGLAAWFRRGELRRDPPLRRALWAGFAGAASLSLTAFLLPASIWGRHYLFLAPFFILALSRLVTAGAGSRARALTVAAFVALLVVFAWSAARQRWLPDYGKDPYREAVAAMCAGAGEGRELPIVLVAYRRMLPVYGRECLRWEEAAPDGAGDGRRRVVIGELWPRSDVLAWDAAHSEYLLVLHRPDTTDPSGAWSAIAARPGSALAWQQGNMRIYHVAHGGGRPAP